MKAKLINIKFTSIPQYNDFYITKEILNPTTEEMEPSNSRIGTKKLYPAVS
jgi:hypothetical protein